MSHKYKLKGVKELKSLAENVGTVVHTKREDFYYFPFWVKVDKDEKTSIVSFEELPDEVIQYINEVRGVNGIRNRFLAIKGKQTIAKDSLNEVLEEARLEFKEDFEIIDQTSDKAIITYGKQ